MQDWSKKQREKSGRGGGRRKKTKWREREMLLQERVLDKGRKAEKERIKERHAYWSRALQGTHSVLAALVHSVALLIRYLNP